MLENDTGEIRTFLIPVEFQMAGSYLVRARTLKEAIDAVEGDDERFGTEAARAEYIDDSFKVNKDCLAVVSPLEREKYYKEDLFVDLTGDVS